MLKIWGFLCIFLLGTAAFGDGIGEKLPANWITQNAGKPYSFEISKALSRHPKGESYRFEIRGGEQWILPPPEKEVVPSYRSEISVHDSVPVGSVQWYGFSQYLPKDFPKVDRRLVLGQWWAKYKKAEGKETSAPPLSLNYRDGVFTIVLRQSDEPFWNGEDPNRTVIFRTEAFRLGEWNDFVFHVKWSSKKDGFIETWMNGKKIVDYRGPVGYRAEPTFKFGLYRDDSDSTMVAYFDRIKRGSSFSEVDPSRLPF